MIKAEWTNKDSLDLQPTCNQLATTEGDLINRADAIKCIRWGEGVTDVIGRIKALPSAGPKTGKWIGDRCSICGSERAWFGQQPDYCPDCGSRMRGEEE